MPMTKEALGRLMPGLQKAVRATGDFILREQARVTQADVQDKSFNSLVSYVDQQAEEQLVSALSRLLPEAGFITEEDTPDQRQAPYQWIIDPLDGTTNYLHGLPVFAVSVALQGPTHPELGVVYELGQRELFHAQWGQGAFLDQQPLRVAPTAQLSEALFATGFPYQDFSRMAAFNGLMNHFFQHSRGLRRLGSAATDLAYVACGRFSGFFEYGLAPWDVAAGALLVHEAGGQVTDFSGGPDYLFSGEIAAASRALHPEMQRLIAHYMN